eukprot:TRINITY_DN12563_c0_g1_i2.p1 TRINITY_DN12563_c0_g1~~TRINITY_DN12563_c0_g1_i2.p1  ORF type:complete len:260 (-),score=65.44 TRINITY_DN12563_c0_g1_i2:68-847(-)
MQVIDELGLQQASFWALRGSQVQILGLDTAILDTFNLLVPGIRGTMPFLPDEQHAWAVHQIEQGHRLGLKTIVMSHHQFFSRHDSVGAANAAVEEAFTLPDQLHGTFSTRSWSTPSSMLPGHLPASALPAANTRLLQQFNSSHREYVSAFYWGHEHSHSVFAPYAGIQRGRLIGNGCVPQCLDQNPYTPSNSTHAGPWGGLPTVLPGSSTGHGDRFWNMGFVTMQLNGTSQQVLARHFEVQFNYSEGRTASRMIFEELY